MRSSVLTLALLLLPAWLVAQDEALPRLDQRVNDHTNTLTDSQWSSLEGALRSFEDTTSNQIAILLVESAGPRGVEDLANRVFERARLGRKDKNNGVLILVALNERTVRIEVGYGLEGVLTDALSRQIIEKEIGPRFRQGQYYEGLIAGIDAIAGAVAGEYTVDRRGQEAPFVGSSLLIAALLFMLFIVRPMLRSRRRLILTSRGVHYDGGWGWPGSFGGRGGFGGGGFGGGGFGGFSGGGGLSGGGGATGRW